MINIQLTDREKAVAKACAVHRRNMFNGQDSPTIVDKTQDQSKIDWEGYMTELAVCKYLNVYPELIFLGGDFSIDRGTDPGDIVYKGVSIDIKHTRYKTGRLISYKKNPAIDLLVLVTGEYGAYTIVGGMDAKEFFKPERYILPPKFMKKCFVAEQKELVDFDKILVDMAA